jgi:uncharacterized protein
MIYEITVPAFIKGLKNLQTFLDKASSFAETKKVDFEVLLNSRLAPDQFALGKQIQVVCDTAKLAAARLTNKEAPAHPDNEKTLPEFKARIQNVISYLQGFSSKDFSESATRNITTPRWNGQYLTGENFALHHAIPNFYFHLTTAYAILRHNGVELGKKDYLGEMPYNK